MILATTVMLGLLIPSTTPAQDDWQQLDDMPVGKWEASAKYKSAAALNDESGFLYATP